MNRYAEIINRISNRLDELSAYNSDSLYSNLLEAEKYSLTGGGKHLRGLIVIKTAMLGGIDIDDSIDIACALEMIHTYSLIHDDLPEMDNDDFRRGLPTCHKKFGADIALLAGDGLLTKAFQVVAETKKFTYAQKIKCVSLLANACGEHGMLAGQTIDKLSENVKIDLETLLSLHSKKTGALFRCAVLLGSVLANLDTNTENLLVNYMSHMGLAFQIKDDILDVVSTSEQLGKPVNSDAGSFKSTFVSMLGLEKSYDFLSQEIAEAKKISKSFEDLFFSLLADFFENRQK